MRSNGRPGPRWDLSALVDEDEWALHRMAVEAVGRRGLPFALGGGLAFSAYSGRWRNTKDVDLFVLPRDREAAVEAIAEAGYEDYFEREPYDREWIYRGYREGVIVDLIWRMANYRCDVEEDWMGCGAEVEMRGLRLPLLAVEDLVFSKLYIVQRDRCDWPDLMSLLYARGPAMDWDRLFGRVGEDRALLGSLVRLFSWLCPPRALDLPDEIWPRLGIDPPEAGPNCRDDSRRVDLLDSREWFGPSENGRADGHG